MIPTLYAALTGGPMFVARGWSHVCGKQRYREVPLLWQMTSSAWSISPNRLSETSANCSGFSTRKATRSGKGPSGRKKTDGREMTRSGFT